MCVYLYPNWLFGNNDSYIYGDVISRAFDTLLTRQNADYGSKELLGRQNADYGSKELLGRINGDNDFIHEYPYKGGTPPDSVGRHGL